MEFIGLKAEMLGCSGLRGTVVSQTYCQEDASLFERCISRHRDSPGVGVRPIKRDFGTAQA